MVQRAIESRGIPTVSPTVSPDVSDHAKPPRSLYLPFMMGHLFGVPFHKELQRDIIMSCLTLLEQTSPDGVQGTFDMTWARARKEGKGLGPSE